MEELGFIFDYAKCVGCHACIVACYTENKTTPPMAWRQVNSYNPKKIPLLGTINLSLACNHCTESPCLKACPARAYDRDEKTGAVIHHPERCIGCRYCTWACPFDAPKYNEEKGVVEKCHLCNQRIIEGLTPACANLCPTGALSFGKIQNSKDFNSCGITDWNIHPLIQTVNSSIKSSIPEINLDSVGFNLNNAKRIQTGGVNPKIQSIHEWPLVLFTLLSAILTGWIFSLSGNETIVTKLFFLGLSVIAVLFSMFHLGQPFKSYRSIINTKTSWLSREILFCGLFNASAFIYLFISPILLLKFITVILGLIMLLSIEMVYSVAKKKYRTPIHSANTFLTASIFAFILSSMWIYAVITIAIKALLYFIRMRGLNFYTVRKALYAFTRTVIGFIVPIGFIYYTRDNYIALLIIALLLGELIDRFDYYDSLYIVTPQADILESSRNDLIQNTLPLISHY